MSKRFTDTDKWKKNSFSKLPSKMKLAWIYLCDNCDHAGVWEANFELMSFQIGEQITKEELFDYFGEKLQLIDCDKVFMQSFIDFQYGKLTDNNRLHKSVLDKIEKIFEKKEAPCKPLGSLPQGGKYKDKEQYKEKYKEKEKEEEAPLDGCVKPQDFFDLWNKMADENALEKIRELSEGRKLVVKEASRKIQKYEDWKIIFNEIPNDSFLLGENERRWEASFDWLFQNKRGTKTKNYEIIFEKAMNRIELIGQ